MKPPTPVPRIRDYLRIVARYWLIVVGATTLSMGAGWLAHQTTDPIYQATSRLVVVAPASAEVFDAYYGHLAAAGRAVSVQQLAKNPQVAKRTIDQLGLHQTPAELIKQITSVSRDAVVEITVTGDTPELARDITNSVTYNLVALTDEMADLEKSGTDVVVVDGASNVADHRAPLIRYLQLGGFLGFGLSVVLVIALGRVRGAVLSEEQVAHIVGETLPERTA
jgi:capsular polysaccharide biosynthesis protein